METTSVTVSVPMTPQRSGLGWLIRDAEVLAVSGFSWALFVETFALFCCLVCVFKMGKQAEGECRWLVGGVEEGERQNAKCPHGDLLCGL